jgi:hypothetical protein
MLIAYVLLNAPFGRTQDVLRWLSFDFSYSLLNVNSFSFQLSETNARIVVCIPETSALVKEAVARLEGSSLKAFCIGDTDWCENICRLAEDVSSLDYPSPHVSNNTENEIVYIMWTSGTTGRSFKVRSDSNSLESST